MCKNEKRTHGTAATGVPVAEMLASEARHTRTSVPDRPRQWRVRRPLSMPFPGRSIERVLRDLATPSNKSQPKVTCVFCVGFNTFSDILASFSSKCIVVYQKLGSRLTCWWKCAFSYCVHLKHRCVPRIGFPADILMKMCMFLVFSSEVSLCT